MALSIAIKAVVISRVMCSTGRSSCSAKTGLGDVVSSGVEVVAINAELSFEGNNVLLPTSALSGWSAGSRGFVVCSAKMQERSISQETGRRLNRPVAALTARSKPWQRIDDAKQELVASLLALRYFHLSFVFVSLPSSGIIERAVLGRPGRRVRRQGFVELSRSLALASPHLLTIGQLRMYVLA